METPERTELAVLADEHPRKPSGNHPLKDDDAGERVKLPRAVQTIADPRFGHPDRPWHEWDEWALGI